MKSEKAELEQEVVEITTEMQVETSTEEEGGEKKTRNENVAGGGIDGVEQSRARAGGSRDKDGDGGWKKKRKMKMQDARTLLQMIESMNRTQLEKKREKKTAVMRRRGVNVPEPWINPGYQQSTCIMMHWYLMGILILLI
jgi:hypothetical protein